VTKPPLTRQTVHHRLHQAQAVLLSAIAGLSEADLKAIQVTTEWHALDILRHLSVWGDLSQRTLANWHGKQNWVLRSVMLDDFNAEMVAERANTPLNEVIDYILTAYKQYATTLIDCSDEELQERATAPWDQELNRLEMIYGILHHDLSHLTELQQIRQQA
jgi:hypothetical protein